MFVIFCLEELEVPTDSKKEKTTKMKYRDMVREDIVKKMNSNEEEDQEDQEDQNQKISSLSFADEQELVRKDILKAVWNQPENNLQDNEEFLVKKSKTDTNQDKSDNEYQKVLQKEMKDQKIFVNLAEFWTQQDGLDQNEKFLRDYIINKRWQGPSNETNVENKANLNYNKYQEEEDDDDKDFDEINKQEDFENVYNFRFEDPHGSSLVTHSRTQNDSVRIKKSKKSIIARARKSELKRIEKQKLEEQKIKLKKQKKQQILKQIEQIKSASGLDELSSTFCSKVMFLTFLQKI